MHTMNKNMLAVDIGAGSGRCILGQLADGKLSLKEISRFVHHDCMINGVLYWNLPEIYNHVLEGIRLATAEAGHLDSIGFDTFAPDFACFNEKGDLLGNMLSYRNFQNPKAMEPVLEKASIQELWDLTGNQLLNFVIPCQLGYLQQNNPYAAGQKITIMPLGNALAYMLSGVPHTDHTQASMSLLNDRSTRSWHPALVSRLVKPPFCLPPILPCGTVLGKMCINGIKTETQVVNVGSHDTACANSIITKVAGEELVINAGTWISVGTVSDTPLVNDSIIQEALNNYGLPDGRNLICKLFIGMGLIRSLKSYAEQQGLPSSYADLASAAESSSYRGSFSAAAPELFDTNRTFPEIVTGLMRNQGVPVPDSFADVVRCVYESLVNSIVDLAEKLSRCTNRSFSKIYMGGGGIQDRFFLKLLKEKTGREIVTLHAESTAIGNLQFQMQALGIDPNTICLFQD